MPLSKPERLKEFATRLNNHPGANSIAEALKIIAELLNAVEDLFSGVPYDPDASETDGRMYPPTERQRRPNPERPDIARYRARGHITEIAANGAIRISIAVPPHRILTDKAGGDGKRVT